MFQTYLNYLQPLSQKFQQFSNHCKHIPIGTKVSFRIASNRSKTSLDKYKHVSNTSNTYINTFQNKIKICTSTFQTLFQTRRIQFRNVSNILQMMSNTFTRTSQTVPTTVSSTSQHVSNIFKHNTTNCTNNSSHVSACCEHSSNTVSYRFKQIKHNSNSS